ncbi:MAG: transposase family protein, partial [Desulfobacteraceae bacterium]|nr:transposase family protein [Desulfobacteraceae bacterium]
MDHEIQTALQKVMFNPKNNASFSANLQQIKQEVQKLVPSVTLDDIKQFRFAQPKIQISRKRIKKFSRVPIFANEPNECWACDTCFLPEIPVSILVFIDVFSRYSFVRTCKKPNADSVISALTSIFTEEGTSPKILFSDLGIVANVYFANSIYKIFQEPNSRMRKWQSFVQIIPSNNFFLWIQ